MHIYHSDLTIEVVLFKVQAYLIMLFTDPDWPILTKTFKKIQFKFFHFYLFS